MQIETWEPGPARSMFSAMSSYRHETAVAAPRYEHEAAPDKIPQWIVLPTAAAISLAGWVATVYAVTVAVRVFFPH